MSRRSQRKKRKSPFYSILLFMIGLGLLTFPLVSQTIYFFASSEDINQFQHTASGLKEEEINRRMELARGYNETVTNKDLQDPYTDKQQAGRREYARMLEVREQIGYVDIPKINAKLPIYAGTSEAVLQKGVGHLEGTSLPIGGVGTHAVLTAHRGLPTARLFTDLPELKKGDIFKVTNMKETLTYRVERIKVVEPDEISEVALDKDKDYVTLLTCTPYMINSHRLLVRGVRIPNDEITKEDEKGSRSFHVPWTLWIWGGLTLVIILGFVVYIFKILKSH